MRLALTHTRRRFRDYRARSTTVVYFNSSDGSCCIDTEAPPKLASAADDLGHNLPLVTWSQATPPVHEGRAITKARAAAIRRLCSQCCVLTCCAGPPRGRVALCVGG